MNIQERKEASSDLGMRSDLYSMLLPFFPEGNGLREYRASLGGYEIRISADNPNIPIATPQDRKILNFLAGTLAHNIRAGNPPSRHLVIDARTMVEALHEGRQVGGSQYNIIVDRLERLMSTVIETEMPLGDDEKRRRRFRWIDAFEHDDKEIPGGRKMLRLRITISEDAFYWMTRTLGFDISRSNFQSVTSYRSSIWRIYEICLVRLITHRGETVHIPIDDLRMRVPISSSLKMFKSRTLKAALTEIPNNIEMSQHIRLDLAKKVNDDYEVTSFSQRAKLDSLYVRVSRGSGPLPPLNTILAKGEIENMTDDYGGQDMSA
jgi:hypothetical protein